MRLCNEVLRRSIYRQPSTMERIISIESLPDLFVELGISVRLLLRGLVRREHAARLLVDFLVEGNNQDLLHTPLKGLPRRFTPLKGLPRRFQ